MHLLDWVAGDQMDEQKDERDHQPDNWNSERETGENLLHGLASPIYERSGVNKKSPTT
jgi:hypothetical protein